MFDKMYLQECEVYFAGDLVGSNSEGELYKGLVCFKIVGLKNTTPYVIKLSSETKINADWLKEELKNCLGILSQSGFSVRAIVCDNHPSNDSSFKKPATTLFYDAAHLVKNIRNNLLKYIRFIFSSFKFDSFKDLINLPDGETKWKFFHDVHEKDAFLEANLKKAPNQHRRYCTQETANKTFRQHLQYLMEQLLLLFNLIFHMKLALLSS